MPSAKMGKKSEEGNSGQTQPLLLGKICHDTNTRRMTQRGGKVCLGRNGIQNPSPSSGENYVRLMGGGWVGVGLGVVRLHFKAIPAKWKIICSLSLFSLSSAWLSLSAFRADVRKSIQGPTDCYYLFNSTHFLYFILFIATL